MDNRIKENCFDVVFDTTFGAVCGLGAVVLYETAMSSILSKTFRVPTVKKILESSASTVPIAAGISLISSVKEIRAKQL